MIMRKLFVAAWLAVSSILAAAPAAADGPVSLPPLAPGEVLLELSAIGINSSPATSAMITARVAGEGETEEDARRAADAVLQQVVAAARAAGVAEADIEVDDDQASSAGLRLFDVEEAVTNAAVSIAAAHAGGEAVIRVRNPATAKSLQRTLAGIENVTVHAPEYRLDDDSAARRSARADAIRRARADADAYAASLNMRVARVLRVTERSGLDFMSLMAGANNGMLRQLEGIERGRDAEVKTLVMVGVDYALAPR